MLVTKSEYKKRMGFCKACPYNKKGFCGDPVKGEKLEDGTKLCGCKMSVKNHLKIWRCPIGNFHRTISDKDIKEMRDLIDSLFPNGVIRSNFQTVAQRDQFWKIYNKHIKAKAPTNCGPCVKSSLEEMKNYLDEADQTTNKR